MRLSPDEIGFRIGKHGRTMPLTIDLVIKFTQSTSAAAASRYGRPPVATDTEGNVYVTGSTNSLNFPSSTNGTKSRLRQPPLYWHSLTEARR